MAAEKNTTAVSIKAKKPYVQSLRALAEKRGISIGLMVRQALDAQLGVELEPLVSFFEQVGNKSFHREGFSSIADCNSANITPHLPTQEGNN